MHAQKNVIGIYAVVLTKSYNACMHSLGTCVQSITRQLVRKQQAIGVVSKLAKKVKRNRKIGNGNIEISHCTKDSALVCIATCFHVARASFWSVSLCANL